MSGSADLQNPMIKIKPNQKREKKVHKILTSRAKRFHYI